MTPQDVWALTDTVPESSVSRYELLDSLLMRPPPGYVFVVTASQDSRYDLFMLTVLKRALEMDLTTLEVVTEARNRKIMTDLASLQGEQFRILEVSFGQTPLGYYTCSPHLHEINILLRELRQVYVPQIVLFEGLTPLLIDFAARDVVQFFKESVEECVKSGSIEFYLIHENATDLVTINQIYSLAHGILSLNTERGKYYLTVRKSTGLDLPSNAIEYVPSMMNNDRSKWGIVLNW